MKKEEKLTKSLEKIKSIKKEKRKLVKLAAEVLIEALDNPNLVENSVKGITIYYDFKHHKNRIIHVESGDFDYEFITNKENKNYEKK